MTLSQRITEDRRLVILRLLEASPGYSSNESLIAVALHDFGHVASRDQVKTDLAWLKENGLVEISEIAAVMVASLTQRGLETAGGLVTTPGVKRPSPRVG